MAAGPALAVPFYLSERVGAYLCAPLCPVCAQRWDGANPVRKGGGSAPSALHTSRTGGGADGSHKWGARQGGEGNANTQFAFPLGARFSLSDEDGSKITPWKRGEWGPSHHLDILLCLIFLYLCFIIEL